MVLISVFWCHHEFFLTKFSWHMFGKILCYNAYVRLIGSQVRFQILLVNQYNCLCIELRESSRGYNLLAIKTAKCSTLLLEWMMKIVLFRILSAYDKDAVLWPLSLFDLLNKSQSLHLVNLGVSFYFTLQSSIIQHNYSTHWANSGIFNNWSKILD